MHPPEAVWATGRIGAFRKSDWTGREGSNACGGAEGQELFDVDMFEQREGDVTGRLFAALGHLGE